MYGKILQDDIVFLEILPLGCVSCPEEKAVRGSGAETLCEELQRVKAPPGTRLDLDTAHVFCQWQCCLQMGLYLNQLLSTPLPEPDLTR